MFLSLFTRLQMLKGTSMATLILDGRIKQLARNHLVRNSVDYTCFHAITKEDTHCSAVWSEEFSSLGNCYQAQQLTFNQNIYCSDGGVLLCNCCQGGCSR